MVVLEQFLSDRSLLLGDPFFSRSVIFTANKHIFPRTERIDMNRKNGTNILK